MFPMKNHIKFSVCKILKRLIQIFLGFLIGYLFASEFRSINYEHFKNDILHQLCSYKSFEEAQTNTAPFGNTDLSNAFVVVKNLTDNLDHNKRRLLLVGVMTAKKFLDSRAETIFKTWGQDLQGNIIFFSSSNIKSIHQLPLVALPNVDDSYPPQKKSFLMFKFMHDHFGDKYKFFMRADDDVFVNVDKLNKFLANLNSSEPIFVGQTGVGNDKEFGQLNLNFKENFCMGGPGVIMSSKTLSLFASNVQNCLKNLYSTHEDVEIGRCVRKYSGASCTWSYDMQNFFYHNTTFQKLILNNVYQIKELFNAITIHPIKDPVAMQNLYLYYQNERHQEVRHQITKAYQDLSAHFQASSIKFSQFDDLINKYPSLKEFLYQARNTNNRLSLQLFNSSNPSSMWKFFSKKLYSELSVNPKKHIDKHIIKAYHQNIPRIMSTINRKSMRKGRLLDYHSLYYGYVRFDSEIGMQYILDLLLIYRKYQGKRLTLPLRRHAYAVQTFSETLCTELEVSEADEIVVNIIVPLAGRVATFKRFVQNLIKVSEEDPLFTITVVLFPDSGNVTQVDETKSVLFNLGTEQNIKVNLLELNGQFSRAKALQQSSVLFENSALLFFLDVDMHFTKEVLTRVRRNTIIYKQLYFPIVYSQYGDQLKFANHSETQTNFDIDNLNGYWRQFGFGIGSLYKCDLFRVGGFNVSIHGWGLEDVNLYDRVVESNLTIFRAIDPDLIHVYHPIYCDPTLSSVQFEMCLGTKLSSLDSVQHLAEYVNKFDLLST